MRQARAFLFPLICFLIAAFLFSPVPRTNHTSFRIVFPVLPTREEMLASLCKRIRPSSFVEVGVQRGRFAHAILSYCPTVSAYVGVDLWAAQKFCDDGSNALDVEQERFYQEARANLAGFDGRWRLVRSDSIAAASAFADSSLDFVYLDARHDYRSVAEDIRAWAPKVRAGGVLSGHDFVDAHELPGDALWVQYKDGTVSHASKAVRSAVTEFAESAQRQVFYTHTAFFFFPPRLPVALLSLRSLPAVPLYRRELVEVPCEHCVDIAHYHNPLAQNAGQSVRGL
jgi:predicted O-methyltransferase YrrM